MRPHAYARPAQHHCAPGSDGRPRRGIFAWFGIKIPFAERMQRIREAGFDTTSLWWEEDDPFRRQLRHHTPDLARSAGLSVDSLHAPYRGCAELWSACKTARGRAVARHRSWIEDCARHAAPRLVMHVAEGPATPGPNEHGVDSFHRLVDAAAASGVTLAIENTRSPEHVDALLSAIPSPRLGLCYDAAHDVLYSREPLALLRRHAHRLEALHLSDTDGRRDRHWLPGAGVIDYRPMVEALPRSYRGAFMLEAVPAERRAACPRAFLAEARTTLSRVLQLDAATGET